MQKSVLAIGIDPKFADYAEFPQLTPELIAAFIDSQLQRLRNHGYTVESCLVDLDPTAENSSAAENRVAQHLNSQNFDCVVIGAGLRTEKHLLLFEKLLNLVHISAPHAKLCFNTTPADTLEAVRRWI